MLKTEIGKAAGLVWEHLAKNGKCSLTNLQTRTKISPETLNQAIGWLAREDKICMSREAKTTNICLTNDETRKYKPTTGYKTHGCRIGM